MTDLTAERRFARTVDGFESQFATNYAGHLDDLNGENRAYKASAAYNDSKLADALFARALQHRVDAVGRPSSAARDGETARQLWAATEDLLNATTTTTRK